MAAGMNPPPDGNEPMQPPDDALDRALKELDEAPDEAREDRSEPPAEAAMNAARELLPKFHAIAPRDYAVYPDHEGGVCIDARGGRNDIMVTWCLADGRIVCNAVIEDAPANATYGNAAGLPDEFMTAALQRLAPD